MIRAIIQAAVVSHKGNVRGNNEDNFYLNGAFMPRERMDEGAIISETYQDPIQLYAVCDGMGGTDCGEDASCGSVMELDARRDEIQEMTNASYLTEVLRSMSERIRVESVLKGERTGTTIALALTDGKRIHIANVGDSRVYKMQQGVLTQISVDHSKVQRMVSMGMITPEMARTDPNRHVISQYLGMPQEITVSPYIDSEQFMKKGDVFLLCSDGLTDMVDDRRIEAVLKEGRDAGEAAQLLVRMALKNGGRDNVTVIILKVLGFAGESFKEKFMNERFARLALTAAQVLTGTAILSVITDLIYYLLHR